MTEKMTVDIEAIHQILYYIQNDIKNRDVELIKQYDMYIETIHNLSGNISTINEIEIYENYIYELSYITVLCCIFSKYISFKFNIEITYENLLYKLDTHNLYNWYLVSENIMDELNRNLDINFVKNFDNDFMVEFYLLMLNKEQKKRLGQFYTPKSIAQYMIKELRINKLDINKEYSILDPACGGGVFLIEIIKQLIKRGLKGIKLADYVYFHLYANDINPFAVILTKINISYEMLPTFHNKGEVNDFINQYLNFENIRIRNTISYSDSKKYDFIIGNPPYFKVTNKLFTNYEYYSEIIFGQPNIYSLFIYWAMKNTVEKGRVSLIVPQSFRTGLYFKELRRKLYELRLDSLIKFESRDKIFKDVDQSVIILTFTNQKSRKNSKATISSVEELNLKKIKSYKVAQNQLMFDEEYDFFFFIPEHKEMYSILEKIYNQFTNLKDEGSDIHFGNGLFVWNQNKEFLINNYEESAAPVIYSNSIKPNSFNYIYMDNKEKLSYSLINEKTKRFLLEGKRLLVQRTSSINYFQRIKAAIISDEFLDLYSSYFLENHINFLCKKLDRNEIIGEELLYFYSALLNSSTLNYVFSCKNGNTQVSATELNLLPISNKNYKLIVEMSKEYNRTQDLKLINDLDEIIYNSYGLTKDEVDHIIRFKEGY